MNYTTWKYCTIFMGMLTIILIIFACFSCSNATRLPTNSPLEFKCNSVYGDGMNIISRCINDEVICYVTYKGGIECKFNKEYK
jgi:hypothetical protein